MNAIETKNLTKRYKDKLAVNNLNLEIKKGELFSLLGVNGAGKTTTIKMLSGLILPTSGDITINGMNMKEESFKIKERLNVSPQETAVAPNLTVKENLEFMAGVYQIKNKDNNLPDAAPPVVLEKISVSTTNMHKNKLNNDKKENNTIQISQGYYFFIILFIIPFFKSIF